MANLVQNGIDEAGQMRDLFARAFVLCVCVILLAGVTECKLSKNDRCHSVSMYIPATCGMPLMKRHQLKVWPAFYYATGRATLRLFVDIFEELVSQIAPLPLAELS